MLRQAVDTYLAVRRAVDFKLDTVERYLRNFTQFATAKGDTHVVAHRDRLGRARHFKTPTP